MSLRRSKPLLRRTGLARGGSLRRRTRLRRVNPRRRAEYEFDAVAARAFVAAHPFCARCGRPSRDRHHAAGRRGSNRTDESTWIAVCRECHDWIHAHPAEAREAGLLCTGGSDWHGAPPALGAWYVTEKHVGALLERLGIAA